MDKIKISVIKNTENLFKFKVFVGRILQNHTSITRAKLRTSDGNDIADSATDATDWDFTNADYLGIKLGLLDVSPGEYQCKLILMDPGHLLGQTWETEILVTIQP